MFIQRERTFSKMQIKNETSTAVRGNESLPLKPIKDHSHRAVLCLSTGLSRWMACSRKTTDGCTNVNPKTMKAFQNQRKKAAFSSGPHALIPKAA